MKKFIGILLALYLLTFLFGADQVNFPDIYIDESVAPGGVGSLADPYSDFSEINWTTGGDNSIFDWYAGAEDASVTINLQKGEEWRETLTIGESGSATYPIIIRPYGSGADPIINGASLETTWGLYGGSTYSKSWATVEVVVVEDGTLLLWGTDEDSLISGQFFADGGDLYVRCTNDADPDTHTMEIGARDCIDWTSKNYVTMDGIHVKYSMQGGIGITTSINCIIQNCTVTSPRTTGIGTWGGAECAPVIISDNTLVEVGREGMYFDTGTLTVGTATISGNTLTDTGWDSGGEGDGIDVKANNTATINILDNTIIYASGLPSMNRTGIISASAITATGNTITNFNRRGIYVPTNCTITKNMISTALTGQSNYLVGIRCSGATTTINYNVIFMPNAETSGVKLGMYWFNTAASGTNIYNNTIYGVDNGLDSNTDLTTSNIKNNIILEYSNLAYRFHVVGAPTGLTIDYNCVYTTDGGADIGRWGAVTENTWAGWKTTSSQDGNSINIDPKLISAGSDHRLLMASPCINAGTDVSLTTDYRGRSIRHAPDIGAYEDPTNAVFMSAKLLSFSDLWLLWNEKLTGLAWWEELGIYIKEKK